MSAIVNIHYNGTVFQMERNEKSDRVVSHIERALAGGGSLVHIEHAGGEAQIAVSPGVPLMVEYVAEIGPLGVY